MYGLHNNWYTIRYCLDDIFYNKERYFHSYIIYVLHRFWGNIVVVCVKPFLSIVLVPPPPPPFLVLFSGQEFPRTAWLYAQGLSIGFSCCVVTIVFRENVTHYLKNTQSNKFLFEDLQTKFRNYFLRSLWNKTRLFRLNPSCQPCHTCGYMDSGHFFGCFPFFHFFCPRFCIRGPSRNN